MELGNLPEDHILPNSQNAGSIGLTSERALLTHPHNVPDMTVWDSEWATLSSFPSHTAL